MAYPFPEKPITADIVATEVGLGGWKRRDCPLCDSPDAAVWPEEQLTKARYLCATCQRFLLTHPHLIGLRNAPEEERRRLSALAAASDEPLEF